MESMNKTYTLSVLAGMAIGLAGTVYLSVDNKLIGSVLFSFGLITIIIQGWSLYTGKVGSTNLRHFWPGIVCMLCGNFIGTLIISAMLNLTRLGPNLRFAASQIMQVKLSDTWWSVLTLSIFCGIMMKLAVEGYKRPYNEHLILITLPIMIFILCGFEHSIANMFYMNLALCYSLKSIGYIFLMIVGNAIGAKFIYVINNN